MMSNRYYVDSLAYDYEMFEPKRRREPDNVVEIKRGKKPSSKTSYANKRAVRVMPSAITVSLVVAVVLMVLLNIVMRVRINEVTSQISTQTIVLERAQSENKDLEMKLESKISLGNLEGLAAENGMKKAEKYQVNYITVNNEDIVESNE